MTSEFREFITHIFAGLAIVLCFVTLVVSIAVGVMHSSDNDVKRAEWKSKTVETCLRSGGVWLNDNCIPVIAK